MEAKTVARMLGKLEAANRALGPIMKIMSKSVQIALNKSVDSVNGWRSSLYLSEEECEDLQFGQ